MKRRVLANPAACLLLAAAAGGCSGPGPRDGAPVRPMDVDHVREPTVRHEPRSQYGNPPFYEVFGKRYYVMESSQAFSQQGVASWYGTKFHGKRTSSGEPYDMYAMTAAHKTLPLPTFVRVTNLENNRAVVVRVNDRGPFVDERIIDLSYAAAIKLDMTRKGTAKVKLEALSPADPALAGEVIPPPVLHEEPPSMVASGQARMYVQVGAFGDPENAARMRRQLDKQGFPTVVRNGIENGRKIYRVRIGPLKDDVGFDDTMSRLKELEYRGAYLALE